MLKEKGPETQGFFKDKIRKRMCTKIRPEFQRYNDQIRTLMCAKIGPEFLCFEEWGVNCNVYKNMVRIPVVGRIR